MKRSISCAAPRPLSNYEIQFIRDRLMDKQYLPLAYFDGATPENNYTPSEPYTLRLYADPRPQDCEAGYLRLYLKTAARIRRGRSNSGKRAMNGSFGNIPASFPASASP